jgi:diguanylate cyclase (GGDEF)-like protein
MVTIPALLLAQPDQPFTGAESEPRHDDRESVALEAEVRRLGVALEALERSPAPGELRAMQKLAHDVTARAEQSGYAEVANAVFHIEDALTAIVDGELETNEATRRQINAAFRSARAACAMRLVEASNSEAAGLRGSLLLVVKDEALVQEITRAASRRKFLASSATGPDEARDIAGAATFSGVIMDFDADSVEQSQALALLLRELPGTRHCPLIVVAENPSFALRLAAARSRATLVLPKPISGDKLVAALQSLDVRDTPEHPRLLLLSDEGEARSLDEALMPLGMTVSPFHDGEQIVEALEATQPAALIIDRQAARADDVCRIVRAIPRWRDLPILLRVTSEIARLAAYEAGADDALADTASNRELVARLQVRLERTRMFREQSNRDPLTGLLTRRALTESMLARLAEARRAKRHLSICFLDLDRFKLVNDTYGHAVGDKVLASFGALLGSRFRLPDLRGRWGGEEFLVAFYGEWAESAREILSRVTAEFSHMTFDGGAGRSFQVTVSGGIATYPVDGEGLEDLVLIADQRLYAAKQAGRNRIRI